MMTLRQKTMSKRWWIPQLGWLKLMRRKSIILRSSGRTRARPSNSPYPRRKYLPRRCGGTSSSNSMSYIRSEVDAAKVDHLAQFRAHPRQAFEFAVSAQKVLASQVRRHLLEQFHVVHSRAGLLQYVGIDVGSQNAKIPAVMAAQRLQQ